MPELEKENTTEMIRELLESKIGITDAKIVRDKLIIEGQVFNRYNSRY